ncbi:MAG: hypothetical protein ACLQHS_13080, partial [Candidatus Limnocylindrales bacterium]
LVLLRESEAGWTPTIRRTRYRALLRADLEWLARGAGFVDLRWILPDPSGQPQPIFLARRAAATVA